MPAEATAIRPEQSASIDELLRAWGMRQCPFAPDDRSNELFPIPAHQEVLTHLDTTAALRSVMALTGPPGTGKSTLIKSWIASLEPKRFLPILITHSSLSATGVLETLLVKLGERSGFKRSANLLTLEKHLAGIEPITLVLILDDAQNYPAIALEDLRLLLGLGGRTRSALILILLGDDYLLGSLKLSFQRALFSRIDIAATLAPLPKEAIADYLAWHIARAGLHRDVFAPAAIDLLVQASEGNARLLGLLVQNAWLAAARQGIFDVEPGHVHTALAQVPAAKMTISQL